MARLLIQRAPPPPLNFDTVGAESYVLTESGVIVGTGSASHANEPAGMVAVTENDFNLTPQVTTTSQGLIGPGWYLVSAGSSNVTLDTTQSDLSRTTTGAYAIRYQTGLLGGRAPCNFGRPFTAAEKGTELYLDFDWKVDPLWSGNATGVNKMMFITAGGISGSPFYFSATGAGLATLRLQARLQGCPIDVGGNAHDGSQNVPWVNSSAAVITRGVAFNCECYAKLNSVDGSGNAIADGILKVWKDGVLIHNATTMAFRGNDANGGSGPTGLWDQIKIDPTYGGGPPNPPYTQYFWAGYMYGSTR